MKLKRKWVPTGTVARLFATFGIVALIVGVTQMASIPLSSASATTSMSVGTAPPSSTFTAIYLASYAHLWQKNNLNVTIVQLSSATGPAALSSDSIQILEDGAGTIIPELEDNSTVLLGSLGFIASRIYAAPGITSLKQMAGKVFGASSAGSSSALVAAALLRQAGLQVGTQVQMDYISAGAPQIAAMQKGLVQASLVVSSSWNAAAAIGWHEIVNTNKTKYSGYLKSVISANRSFATSHKTAVVGFLKSQLEAQGLFKHHHAEAEAALVAIGGLTESAAVSGFATGYAAGAIKVTLLTRGNMDQLLASEAANYAPAGHVSKVMNLVDASYLTKAMAEVSS